MEEATASAAPVAPRATTDERGFGPRLVGLLLEPREEFPSIVARPRFWLPLVCWMVLGMALTAVWMRLANTTKRWGLPCAAAASAGAVAAALVAGRGFTSGVGFGQR